MDALSLSANRAGLMYLTGFREACCLHRALLFCFRSRALSISTGQCFLLNGLIFIGSLSVLNSVVVPILAWILPSQGEQFGLRDGEVVMAFYSFLRHVLIYFFYLLWFCPLMVVSLILSTIWHGDIAKHAYDVVKRQGSSVDEVASESEMSNLQESLPTGRPCGFEGAMLGIGEKVYSFLLLLIFWIEASASGYIPYIGMAAKFLLLSWMYAYYCFEYKWDYTELSLDERLDFFESNWAFFAGFGTPCVLGTFFVSVLVSSGIWAILFPLFVLTAASTKAELVVDSLRRSSGGPGKLKIFYVANNLSMLALQFFQNVLQKVPKEQ